MPTTCWEQCCLLGMEEQSRQTLMLTTGNLKSHSVSTEPHLLNQRGVKWQQHFWLPEGLPSMRTFRSQPKNISKLDHWQLVLIVSPVLRARQSFKHKQGGIWPLPITFLEDSSTPPKPEQSLVAVTLLFGCLHPVGGGVVFLPHCNFELCRVGVASR